MCRACSPGLYLRPYLNTFDVSGGFLCLLQDDIIPQMTGQQNCLGSPAAGLPFSRFKAQRHVFAKLMVDTRHSARAYLQHAF